MESLIIKIMADWLLVVIFVMAMYSFLFLVPRKKWWSWAWRIVLVGVLTYGLAKLAGYIYQPEVLRPFEKLGTEPGATYLANPGFPSDHALFAMFLTVAVWVSTRNKIMAGIMATLTVIMSVGRVLALVHTVPDVIAGMVISLVGLFIYRLLRNKML